MSQFLYRPLDRAKHEIRLVQLLPRLNYNIEDDCHIKEPLNIHCHLWHVSLDENPVYTGLSYVWGDATRTKPIFVYERDVSSTIDVVEEPKLHYIPDNLNDALITLREPKEPLTFWIDAICINQDDNDEKSWQVQQMARIFSTASSVTAWLGQAADDSDLLFDMLYPILCRVSVDCSQLMNHTTQPTLAVEEWHRLLITREPRASDEGLERFILDFADLENNSTKILWRAMMSLTNRQWWRRIWIIQEFVLAKSIQFACGTKRCAGEHLRGLRNIISFLFEGYFTCRHISILAMEMWFTDPLSVCSEHMFLYRDVTGHSDWSFADLLMSLCDPKAVGATFEASDPRDRIFALLQIDPDRHQVPIVVDYSMSCSELYTAVAHYLIRSCDANVLRYSQVPKLVKGLPSWAPDWSAPIRPPNDWNSYTPKLGATSASAWMKQNWLDGQPKTANNLSIRGVSVGQVLNVVGSFPNIKPIQDTGRSVSKPSTIGIIQAWLLEVHLCSQLAFSLHEKSRQAIENTEEISLDVMLKTILPIAERDHVETWPRYQKLITVGIKGILDSDSSSHQDTAHFFGHFCSSVGTHCDRRRLYVTSNGYFGLGPDHVRPSDRVIIVYGVDTPLIIRQVEDFNFEVVGETYIDELMEGQFMSKNTSVEIFNLC